MTVSVETNQGAVKALPQGWRMVKFGEIAENISDRIDDPSKAGVDIYVGLDHLDSESLKIRRWGTPADVEATKLRFKTGDIIFGKRRAYQRKVAVAEFDGICSAHAMVLRAREEAVVKEFLPFLMQSDAFFDRALAISEGSLSPTIKWKTLAQQEFALPPKDEQRRIADILWAADETIEKWEEVKSSFARMEMAFREGIVCDSQYQRERLGKYLVEIVPGRSVVGVNEPALANEFGVLKISAVSAQGFEASENKRILNVLDFQSVFKVHTNDLLITRCNTTELVGRVCLVPRDYSNLMLCDKTLRLEVNEEAISKRFLLEALRSQSARTQIESVATGTGGSMKNISQNNIRALQIPVPEPEKQREIVSQLEVLERNRQDVMEHLFTAKGLKRLLVETLISADTALKELAVDVH